jgi:flagellar hook protein FlgE
MYAAISGLKSHMQKLNVIGNNIANVNTTAYKSQRTVFRSELYTSVSSGSNGTTTTGGTNPSQIGYGATVASIDVDMSTGTSSPTGKGTDCMLDGDGFFMVGEKTVAETIDASDSSSLKALTLTRTGDFEFKADGYLSDGEGNAVYGFQVIGTDENGQPIISDQLVPLRLPTYDNATKTVIYPWVTEGGDLTADAIPLTNATKNTGTDADPVLEDYPYAEFDSITIDSKTGKITGIVKDTDEVVNIGFIAIANVTNPNGVTLESGTYYKCGEGAGDMTVAVLGGLQDDTDVKVLTNDATADTLEVKNGNNKYTAHVGTLDYVNGSLLGYGFDTTGGATAPTTSPDGMTIKSAGTTSLITGGLEASTTDLATEISEMITTQRGYQANTRIVTVTDSMLEELVNMKR